MVWGIVVVVFAVILVAMYAVLLRGSVEREPNVELVELAEMLLDLRREIVVIEVDMGSDELLRQDFKKMEDKLILHMKVLGEFHQARKHWKELLKSLARSGTSYTAREQEFILKVEKAFVEQDAYVTVYDGGPEDLFD